jgi:cyclopropane fatty-acyl-phospholipid synthase-like methyltransferase
MQSFEEQYYEATRFWDTEDLHDANNTLRIETTAKVIPPDTKTLVDIGCGNGVFLHYLQEKAPSLELLGVDRSNKALEFVKTKKLKANINCIPLDDGAYDCVTCLEVIEHLPVSIYGDSLKELARVSNKYIIISVPYRENLKENHTQCPQCKSIFNADLHMRSFEDPDIEHLFEPYGFACSQKKKFGEQLVYKGHHQYRALFYPQQFRMWRSPICPICGFQNDNEETITPQEKASVPVITKKSSRSLISYFSVLPKLFWPKEKKYYELIALYRKQ